MSESEDPKKVSNNDLRDAQFGGGFINAETVNAQKIGGDIWNFFFWQQTAPVGNPARPENQRLLLARVKYEVGQRLDQSLHNAVLINLGKELQPQQVKRSWDAEVKIGLKPPESLPQNTSIVKVFDDSAIAGKLLILGEPGSGKTTTQLELAQTLIHRTEEQPNYPIPVLFNLSSWKDDKQSIRDWLVAELKSKYGVRKDIGEGWVDNRQLLPMLDGVDELESARQEFCVQAINKLLQSECSPQYLVVGSRSEEYTNYKTRLQLNGAICLQPLTKNQIFTNLVDVNHSNIWQTINDDPNLLELVKTPLLLSVTILAYQEIAIEQWQQMTSTFDRLQYLLNAYVRRMLIREIDSNAYFKQTNSPSTKQTQLWLIWLDQQLERESQTEFLIETIQPFWLLTQAQRVTFKITSGLVIGLTVGLIGGLGLNRWLPSLILGLLVGFAFGRDNEINIVENFLWSWKGAKIGLILGLVLGLIDGLRSGLIYGIFYGLVYSLILGLFFGLLIGLGNRPSELNIETRIRANQGIKKSAVNAGIIGITVIAAGVLDSLSHELSNILSAGLIAGFILSLNFGSEACIKHFILRVILYFNGYIPWNYARFLDYATERLFLQRVGGRYRFIHKMLQEHFAKMQLNRMVD